MSGKLTELFEVITKEEFKESGAASLEASVGYVGQRPADPVAPDNTLVWCDFCKGHYNEYHFGDIDEGSEELVASR